MNAARRFWLFVAQATPPALREAAGVGRNSAAYCAGCLPTARHKHPADCGLGPNPPYALRRSGLIASQRGFAVVTAIFLLVVLSALGAFMVSISTTHHAGEALDIQGARAYQAARAGIEWGVWQVMNPENTNPAAAPYTTQYACAGSPTTLPALGGTLAGFTVVVNCAFADHRDAGMLKRVYTLTSTASWGRPSGPAASLDFVERQVTVTLSTCRQAVDGASC